MRARGYVAVAALVGVSAVLVTCGGDETRYGDAKIIDKLNLEKVDGESAYSVDGSLYCNVEKKLLNTSEEVEETEENSEINLVVASKEGNVGVVGVPIFDNDCQVAARKKLNRLDSSD